MHSPPTQTSQLLSNINHILACNQQIKTHNNLAANRIRSTMAENKQLKAMIQNIASQIQQEKHKAETTKEQHCQISKNHQSKTLRKEYLSPERKIQMLQQQFDQILQASQFLEGFKRTESRKNLKEIAEQIRILRKKQPL